LTKPMFHRIFRMIQKRLYPNWAKKITSSPHGRGGSRWGERFKASTPIPTFPHRKGEGDEIRNHVSE
jgi:hypothetical protein